MDPPPEIFVGCLVFLLYSIFFLFGMLLFLVVDTLKENGLDLCIIRMT